MKKYIVFTIFLITIIFFVSLYIFYINQNDSSYLKNELGTSYPLSFNSYANLQGDYEVINDTVYKRNEVNEYEEITDREGLYDKVNNLLYYTRKDPNNWGAEKYIYVYSFNEKRIVREIEFDNSGFFKYPISLNTDSTKIALLEVAQSVGESNINIIDVLTGDSLFTITKEFSTSGTWVDEKQFLYVSWQGDCEDTMIENCLIKSIWLSMYNGATGNISEVAKIASVERHYPMIDSMDVVNNKLIVKYSVLDPIDALDINTKNHYTFEFDLNNID